MKLVQFASSLALIGASSLVNAAVIATDNFENDNPGTAYNNGIEYGDNGGSGFGALTYLEGTNGGLFNSSLSGSRALGIFASTGGQALGRTVTTTTAGTFTFKARFNVDNSVAFSGLNLKSALGTTLGTSEIISIGLTPGTGNNSIFVGGSLNTTIPLAVELRGTNLDFVLDFDTNAGTFTLGAKREVDGSFTSVSGSLKDTNGGAAGVGALAAIGFGNFNTGDNQNLTVDNLSLVPEPSAALLGGLGALMLLRRRRI